MKFLLLLYIANAGAENWQNITNMIRTIIKRRSLPASLVAAMLINSGNVFADNSPNINLACDELSRSIVQKYAISDTVRKGWYDQIFVKYNSYFKTKPKTTLAQQRISLVQYYDYEITATIDQLNIWSSSVPFCSLGEIKNAITHYRREIKKHPKQFKTFAMSEVDRKMCDITALYQDKLKLQLKCEVSDNNSYIYNHYVGADSKDKDKVGNNAVESSAGVMLTNLNDINTNIESDDHNYSHGVVTPLVDEKSAQQPNDNHDASLFRSSNTLDLN